MIRLPKCKFLVLELCEGRFFLFCKQDQSRRISFLVAADDENFLPKFDKGGERILGCSGFGNTSLSVKSDLTQSSHCYFLFVFEPTEVMPRHRTRLVGAYTPQPIQEPHDICATLSLSLAAS